MFIAKDKDLIILAKDTREELEQALQFMVYTSIEETETEYQLYNGSYLTTEEVNQREQERINHLTMTALDLISAVKQLGATDEMIEDFLNSNLEVKHQLQFCQNVYCGVAKSFCPIKIGQLELSEQMIEDLFKAKNNSQA